MSAADFFYKAYREDSLKATFASSLYGTTATGIDRITPNKFKDDLDNYVSVITRKVLSGSYSFTPYRQILISKGAKKSPRELSVPTVRDRLVLKALSTVIDNTFATLCRTPQPQLIVSELSDALLSKSYAHYLKLDLHDYYSSIPHSELIKTVRSRIRKPEILKLILKAITTPTVPLGAKATALNTSGLPQGLSISNQLANLYASKLDNAIRRKFPHVFYRRYVDDIIVLSSNNDLDAIKDYARKYASSIGLELNDAKSYGGDLQSNCFEYLGYLFQDELVSIRKSSKEKIERSLERQVRAIARSRTADNSKSLNTSVHNLYRRITGCEVTYDGVTFTRYGWLFYFSRINDVAYLGKLDSLVRKIANRYSVSLGDNCPKFKTAYYQMRYNCRESHYFPVFDFSKSVDEIKSQLTKLLGLDVTAGYSDEEIRALFQKTVHRITRSLEKDIGALS